MRPRDEKKTIKGVVGFAFHDRQISRIFSTGGGGRNTCQKTQNKTPTLDIQLNTCWNLGTVGRGVHLCRILRLWASKACPLLKPDLSSLGFAVNRFFMKLFRTSRTSSIDVVKQCQYHFGFPLPSVLWAKRVQKFEAKFYACNNLLCKINVW